MDNNGDNDAQQYPTTINTAPNPPSNFRPIELPRYCHWDQSYLHTGERHINNWKQIQGSEIGLHLLVGQGVLIRRAPQTQDDYDDSELDDGGNNGRDLEGYIVVQCPAIEYGLWEIVKATGVWERVAEVEWVGGSNIGIPAANNEDNSCALSGINIWLSSTLNEPSIMTAWSPWALLLPTHSRSTWDCSMPTCPKLMHLPFLNRGSWIQGPFLFVMSPSLCACYPSWLLPFLPCITPIGHLFLSSPFHSHLRLQGVQQGVSTMWCIVATLNVYTLLCSAWLWHFFLTIVHYIHVICRHLISHVYNNCMPL